MSSGRLVLRAGPDPQAPPGNGAPAASIQRFGAAWTGFVPEMARMLDVVESLGPEAWT
jgi:hypothetical protein